MQANKTNKKKKSPRPAKPATSENQKATGRPVIHVKLSKHTSDYARALVDASPSGPLASLPTLPVLKSKRTRIWSKSTMSTGTAGIGFVCADPRQAAANDCLCIYESTSAYAGSIVDLDNAVVGVNGQFSNSEFQFNQFGSDLSARVVSANLNIKYSGTELNRGGTCYGLQDADHSVAFDLTIAEMEAEEQARKFDTAKKWRSVIYRPSSDADEDFFKTFIAGGTNPIANVDDQFYMTWMVQAPAGVTLTFDVEFWCILEFQGRNVRGMDLSASDATGYQAVHMASQLGSHLMPTEVPAQQRQMDILKGTAAAVAHHSSHIVETTGHVVKAVGDVAKTVSTAAAIVDTFLDFFF